jgi:hypothetical protein
MIWSLPTVQIGGTMMANDVILGSSGTTKFISDGTGTYIYSNLHVSGNINNDDLTDEVKLQSHRVPAFNIKQHRE